MLKRIVVRIALWRLNRKIDKLEERFVSMRADLHRREGN